MRKTRGKEIFLSGRSAATATRSIIEVKHVPSEQHELVKEISS